MDRDHLLAIDAGTGSCRAVIFNRRGNQVAVSQCEWSHPHAVDSAGPNSSDRTQAAASGRDSNIVIPSAEPGITGAAAQLLGAGRAAADVEPYI